jgi:ATP/ADP translocase
MDTETEKMARSMNLSQVNLNKMKQVIDGLGEKVTSSTGSPTLDNLLVASGLLK